MQEPAIVKWVPDFDWKAGIALLALVQPWLLGLWRRLKRGGVEFHETGQFELGFSNFGLTIGLHGSFACECAYAVAGRRPPVGPLA